VSDGASHGPYRPITDADIMPNRMVGLILDSLLPDERERLTRHMMAVERRNALSIERKALAVLKRHGIETDTLGLRS
jgi:hypothetical protein